MPDNAKKSVQAVAIGSFDGLHRGHNKLIEALGDNGALIVIESPKANLTPARRREEFAKIPCFFYPLDTVKNLRGDYFIGLIKRDFPSLKRIVVGYDFKFGKDRGWDKYDLKSLFDGEIIIIPEFSFDGMGVHSSAIRRFLQDGDIYRANRLLGREYSIEAKVIAGQGIGKKELYPTLNLDITPYLAPAQGVYATRTRIGENTFCSVSFVGNRLSTDGKYSIETHVIDEQIEVAPEKLRVCFIERIRDNAQFGSLTELKAQIARDIAIAKSAGDACYLTLREDDTHARVVEQ